MSTHRQEKSVSFLKSLQKIVSGFAYQDGVEEALLDALDGVFGHGSQSRGRDDRAPAEHALTLAAVRDCVAVQRQVRDGAEAQVLLRRRW